MPTDAEQLATIKSQTLALLVSLTENPKPSYDIDGQEISWNEYRRALMLDLEKIDQQIAANTVFEVSSQGFT